ncbi:MAG: hypothetical protein U5N55_09795 [Cypionkella sp.]|nr:hypothetical protein [Cypionkella sp.]
MKIALMMTAAAFSLSACLGNGGGEVLSDSEIAKLAPTKDMPTGSASYSGSFESETIGSGFSYVATADLALNANFDASTVSASLSNFGVTQVEGDNTVVGTATGKMTGDGLITGSAFVAQVDGILTVSSLTLNGEEVDAVADQAVGDKLDEFATVAGQFVGEDAAGIYGQEVEEFESVGVTTTVTIVGNKD